MKGDIPMSEELKCPHCGELFQLDESHYMQLSKQVRDKEFARDLEKRKIEIEKTNASNLEIEKMKQEAKQEKLLKEKDIELQKKEQELEKLKNKLLTAETDRKLAVSEMKSEKERELTKKEKELDELKNKLSNTESQKKLAVKEVEQEKEKELLKKTQEILEKKNKELEQKNAELAKLKSKIEKSETEQMLAISKIEKEKTVELSKKKEEIFALKNQMEMNETEKKLSEKRLKEAYETQLKMKDEQIEQYKDFKMRQSTKMIGESLEVHCSNQFNSIRMTAFPNAYFEKDNDARSGSKGDFIFRESQDGTEFISIMFEMKNEMDTTATKHKNEDFFKELDKDRREKKCEYAILVSMLESENDLYNNGIVDVSYRYEKMYVIRPQFFIPIIALLRNAALNSLKYKHELQIVQNQQLDFRNFEENMLTFKEAFGRNYRIANERFQTAIEEIDKTITHLQKTKEALMSSDRNLRLANDKANDLSIKKLTTNAPSVRKMFEENE